VIEAPIAESCWRGSLAEPSEGGAHHDDHNDRNGHYVPKTPALEERTVADQEAARGGSFVAPRAATTHKWRMASTCSEAPGRPLDPVSATKALPRPLPAWPWRATGHRNGHRDRPLDTTFDPVVLSVPRARLTDPGGEREWRSALLPAYRRLSRRAELLIARVYLAGVNTQPVRRALQGVFAGHLGKDVVSRAWQRTRSAWEADRSRLAGRS
jgi:Transposase, Mutator family